MPQACLHPAHLLPGTSFYMMRTKLSCIRACGSCWISLATAARRHLPHEASACVTGTAFTQLLKARKCLGGVMFGPHRTNFSLLKPSAAWCSTPPSPPPLAVPPPDSPPPGNPPPLAGGDAGVEHAAGAPDRLLRASLNGGMALRGHLCRVCTFAPLRPESVHDGVKPQGTHAPCQCS